MKNCIVAQSGGPTVAINASLSGVIRGALESDKIDNDLKEVDRIIREYYDMKPLVDNKPTTTKKTETKGE